jgi:cytoskeletal protein RodZ
MGRESIFSRASSADLDFQSHGITKNLITAIAVGALFLVLFAIGLGVLIFFWHRHWKRPEVTHIGPGSPSSSSTLDIEKVAASASTSEEVVVIPAPKEVDAPTISNEKDLRSTSSTQNLTVEVHPPPQPPMPSPPPPARSPAGSSSPNLKPKTRVDIIREEKPKRDSFASDSSLEAYGPPTPQDLKFGV